MRPEKIQAVEDIKGHFDKGSAAVFLDYSGMTVAEVSNLRSQFRAQGVTYKVLKNSLVRRALGDAPYVAQLKPVLKGMTAVAFSGEEPGAAARVVKAFVKDNEKLKIKTGLLDGQVLDAKTVENQLATLPSKDEARAMLLATFMAPAQRFVMLLNTPAGNFVRLLEAKKAKDGG
jgi:large subunit ribosomal protein L10